MYQGEYTSTPSIMGTGQIKHLKHEAYVSGSTLVLIYIGLTHIAKKTHTHEMNLHDIFVLPQITSV